MGVMGSVSVNLQVRSFCNYSSIPPRLDSPFSSFFVRLSVSLILLSPSHLSSLSYQCFLILLLLQHFLFSSIFGIIMDEQKLRPPPLPFPSCARPRSLLRMARFSPQQRVHLCHICQPELPSTRAPTVPSIPTSMPASMSYPGSVLVKREFQYQRQQGGSSPSFRFRQFQSTESASAEFAHASLGIDTFASRLLPFCFLEGDDQGNVASTPPYPLSWTPLPQQL
jgi:hypothetical protein